MRGQNSFISEKIKNEIRLYKQVRPNCKYGEIIEHFAPKIGRRVHKATISDIIRSKTEVDKQILAKAKTKLIEQSSDDLVKVIKNRIDHLNTIEAKVIVELSRKMDEDDGRTANELVNMLKNLTDIRGKILGIIEIGIEHEGSPEKLRRLELLEDLISDVENTKTKITQKITAIRPDPIKRTEGSDSGGEIGRGAGDREE